jgi:hypothetical protein
MEAMQEPRGRIDRAFEIDQPLRIGGNGPPEAGDLTRSPARSGDERVELTSALAGSCHEAFGLAFDAPLGPAVSTYARSAASISAFKVVFCRFTRRATRFRKSGSIRATI